MYIFTFVSCSYQLQIHLGSFSLFHLNSITKSIGIISSITKYRLFFLCACIIVSVSNTLGQEPGDQSFYSSLRTARYALQDSIAIYDSSSIVPGSVSVKELETTCYHFDHTSSILRFNGHCDRLGDSITITYRVFPFSFSKKMRLNNYSFDSNYVFLIKPQQASGSLSELVNFKSLDYTGSYSRSMNVGNNQDLNLNSNFNLQLSGYLLDSIRIEGAITDNTIPFQPDGNTQRIQEFDRLYITFEKNKHKLTVGDYNLDDPTGYFLNFNKRVQGVYYQGSDLGKGTIRNTTGFSASVAKGQFARNIFQGIEGNQGPYKLTGNNGEQFFILLAGTEKVYIDGVLLQRGEDRDYIIDYNLAQIIFMPRVLITKDKRIQVEFEYQDRNYLNSLIYAYDHLQINKKLSFDFSIYANQDAKNQPFMTDMTEDQRRFLHRIGDDTDNAFYRNVTTDTFAANKILYEMRDTLVSGILYDSVFVYSTDSALAKYNLSFSYVGEGKGNYIVSSENSNGRSYQWVAPVDGVLQGAYEPVMLLITPKLHHIYTAAANYQIDSLKKITVEASMSNYDPNLYSPGNNAAHLGYAGKFNYSEKRLMGKKDSTGAQKVSWTNQVDYEYVQAKYRAIAPYRNVEFSRDWNVIGADSTRMDEHLVQYNTQLERSGTGNIRYQFMYYKRGNEYTATKNEGQLNYIRKSTKAGLILNLMNSKSANVYSSFWRPAVYAEQLLKGLNNLTIGARYQLEHNTITLPHSDMLVNNAYSFNVINAYIKGGKSTDIEYGINYSVRKDRFAKEGSFADKNMGQTIDLNISLKKWENQQLDFTGGYRHLESYDSIFNSIEVPGTTILGRLTYTGNIKKGFFIPTLLYEFGSGQEQKRAYTYVEVPAGQGMYYWVDYNEDGVQQANEFEPGLYPDQKKFIRIITPTNEYNKVNYYRLNASFVLNPATLFGKDQKGVPKLLSRFSDQFSMELDNRVLSSNGFAAYVPFSKNFADTSMINYSSNLINTLFFNRTNTRFGAEYMIHYTELKALLTYGLETSNWLRHNYQLRYNFSKKYGTLLKIRNGYRAYNSGVNDSRTYNYTFYGFSPSFTILLESKARFTFSYEYDHRQNKVYFGNEKAIVHSAVFDSRFSFKNIGSLQVGGKLSMIAFNGDESNGIGIAMLDALRIGNNYLWNVQWNTRVSKGIEMSLQYDGRKPGDSKIIHTGSVSLRALL